MMMMVIDDDGSNNGHGNGNNCILNIRLWSYEAYQPALGTILSNIKLF